MTTLKFFIAMSALSLMGHGALADSGVTYCESPGKRITYQSNDEKPLKITDAKGAVKEYELTNPSSLADSFEPGIYLLEESSGSKAAKNPRVEFKSGGERIVLHAVAVVAFHDLDKEEQCFLTSTSGRMVKFEIKNLNTGKTQLVEMNCSHEAYSGHGCPQE